MSEKICHGNAGVPTEEMPIPPFHWFVQDVLDIDVRTARDGLDVVIPQLWMARHEVPPFIAEFFSS